MTITTITYDQAQTVRELVHDLGDLASSADAIRRVLRRSLSDTEIDARIQDLTQLGQVEEVDGRLMLTAIGRAHVGPAPRRTLRDQLAQLRRATWQECGQLTI